MPDLPMRRLLSSVVSFGALLLLTQCAEHDPVRRFASSQVSTDTSDAATAATLISQYRASHGLSPVRVDARLPKLQRRKRAWWPRPAPCPMAHLRVAWPRSGLALRQSRTSAPDRAS